jgi:hypothetical protein
MPLTPAAYRDLLAPHNPRLYRDSVLLDQVLDGYVDLSKDEAVEALDGEPALVIVASRDPSVFRNVTLPSIVPAPDTVILNPLYDIAVRDGHSLLTLTFPTDEYAQEFEATKRYLPETLSLPGDLTTGVDRRALGRERYEELVRRMVFISAPQNYV